MDFTVIVCTYNRCGNLPSCLGALARQVDVEGLDWEVLVVDNNSTDNTRGTVERLATELPIKLRYAREEQQGLNHARNRGVTSSSGTHFTFVDDDIRVSPRWLGALRAAFAENDADAVGGRIHLDPSVELPAWVAPGSEIAGFLGYQDFGERAFRMDGRDKYPFGGNMSFHRRVVDRIGLFDPRLGRKGEGRKRGELFKGAETDYFNRLAAASPEARIFYEPRAIVYHRVQPFQLQQRYFLTIHFNAGFQKARYDTRRFPRRALGVPLFLYPQLTRAVAGYVGLLVTRGPDRAFRQLMTVGHFLGTMAGYRNASREPGMSPP